MVGCSIQNFCAIITQIESSIYKLVEQKTDYKCMKSYTVWRDCLQIKFYTDNVIFAYTDIDALHYFWLLNWL